jgi:hypothetical protein
MVGFVSPQLSGTVVKTASEPVRIGRILHQAGTPSALQLVWGELAHKTAGSWLRKERQGK